MQWEFKKLDIEQEGNWIQQKLRNPHFKKTIVYVLIGSMLSFGIYYFSEGMHMDKMPQNEIVQSIVVGAFFGLFITNSPCARGKC